MVFRYEPCEFLEHSDRRKGVVRCRASRVQGGFGSANSIEMRGGSGSESRKVARLTSPGIFAAMTSAQAASKPGDRMQHLREAVVAGLQQWLPERRARKVAWWDELKTRPLLFAIYALAHQAATMGHRDDAALCIKQLLKMDPADRIGAEELGRTVGLFPSSSLGDGCKRQDVAEPAHLKKVRKTVGSSLGLRSG